jgi:CRISPR system Cascade subunit CasE
MNAKKQAPPGRAAELVDEAAVNWLMLRSSAIGLEIDIQHLRRDGYRQHVASRAGGRPLRFSSLDFDGCATVTDAGRLTEALLAGVGHSKGFGCGLLLVRRL